jgi:hypothetical protein
MHLLHQCIAWDTYLQRLDLSRIYYTGEGSLQALASALLENKGLTHFGLCLCRLDNHCWSELMADISTHATLRTLKFRDIRNVDGLAPSSSEKRDKTKAIANMLLVNKHIDEIPFRCGKFRLIGMTGGMHSLPRELSASSTGSGYLQSRR